MPIAASHRGPVGIGAANLAGLAALDRSGLRQLWRELFAGPMPAKASRSLLIGCLAYRIQENAYGGLPAAVRTRLRTNAQQLPAAARPPTRKPIAPGTRLIRQWRAQRNEVTVLERGYLSWSPLHESVRHRPADLRHALLGAALLSS